MSTRIITAEDDAVMEKGAKLGFYPDHGVVKPKPLSRTVCSLGGHICDASGQLFQHPRPTPLYMNGIILKSQKLLADVSNQEQNLT